MKNFKIWFLLLVIFFVAYFLRVMNLSQNVLTFGYDQARDAVISQQILNGDFKIQGPPSSAPGLFHGVFYYYVLAFGYLFSDSPIIAAYWIAFLNAVTLFVVYVLTYQLTKSKITSLLSSLLFAFSFESTQYATWLSNPTIAVLTVPLIYLGLWNWINNKGKVWPVLTGLALGLSIQAEIFLAYHIVPIIIWIYSSRKNVQYKEIIISLASLFVAVFTLILCELKFGFTSIDGIKSLLLQNSSTGLAYAKSVGDYLILYLNQIGRIFAFNSIPSNVGYGGGLVIFLVCYFLIKRDRVGTFLSVWLLSHLSVVTMGGNSTPFLMVGIGPAVSIIIAYWLSGLNRYLATFILLVILVSNLSIILRENKNGSTLFSIQNGMTLDKQLKLVDFTYQNSSDKKFTINSVTSPLWINIVWSYLYNWYGMQKYGFVPEFHGRDQIGQVTQLPQSKDYKKSSFLIIEPMGGIPVRYLDETLSEENSRSKFLEEKNWGELRVQKRETYVRKQ